MRADTDTADENGDHPAAGPAPAPRRRDVDRTDTRMIATRIEPSWCPSRYRARVSDGPVARARAALSRGDVLIAYDEATSAVESDPYDLEARFVAALALARAGASDRARTAANELLTAIESGAAVPVSLREDAEALVARLTKDEALASSGDDRRFRLRRAADLYDAVAERFGRYYSCINAASLRLLAGDVEPARRLARRARDLVGATRESDPSDEYWREATEAEAALILGDVELARQSLSRAATIAGDDFAALAVTRRQLRLVCKATSTDDALLDILLPPLIVHYCGHRLDLTGGPPRFPPGMEEQVDGEIRAFLSERRVGFAYGSLASGADILTAEALLDAEIPLQVVLPFDVDEFERTSVAPAGAGWSERFRTCLARVSSVTLASDSSFMNDDELYGYAARIAMGHALNHATFLDAPAEQLAVWDRAPAVGVAGTAHDVAVWAATGRRTHVIALPAPTDPRRASATAHPATTRRIGVILFSDFRGFSRLRDEQFPIFVNEVFATLGAVLDDHADAVLWRNSWGDAIAAVFADVVAAADCAIGLQEALARIDLARRGLPADLGLRIGAHAGPVIAIADPISHKPTYWGRELTRAARIEPRTPEGEVYVTDAFAALLALEPDAQFATDYVGRITTAREFETIPMYQLRRRTRRSAREAP